MTTKEKVLSHIREQNKEELMKLEFGCQISRTEFVIDNNHTVCWDLDMHEWVVLDDSNYDVEEIIGKPPELRHLLVALGEVQRKSLVQANGVVCYWHGDSFEEEVKTIICEINLKKPLTDQEPEVYARLAEVFGLEV